MTCMLCICIVCMYVCMHVRMLWCGMLCEVMSCHVMLCYDMLCMHACMHVCMYVCVHVCVCVLFSYIRVKVSLLLISPSFCLRSLHFHLHLHLSLRAMGSEEVLDRDSLFRKIKAKPENKVPLLSFDLFPSSLPASRPPVLDLLHLSLFLITFFDSCLC
jgi:hypothetical protein